MKKPGLQPEDGRGQDQLAAHSAATALAGLKACVQSRNCGLGCRKDRSQPVLSELLVFIFVPQ